MKKDWKERLWVWIVGILVLGMLSGWIAGKIGGYEGYQKPGITPPDWVFPAVWSILYVLMAISGWMVYRKGQEEGISTQSALLPFAVQLGLNLTWSPLFFGLHQFCLGFLWAVLLDAAVLWMILSFCRISRKAALLQLPYLAWGLFAAVLSFLVCRMN